MLKLEGFGLDDDGDDDCSGGGWGLMDAYE